jgi:hypothetical protein
MRSGGFGGGRFGGGGFGGFGGGGSTEAIPAALEIRLKETYVALGIDLQDCVLRAAHHSFRAAQWLTRRKNDSLGGENSTQNLRVPIGRRRRAWRRADPGFGPPG